MEIENCFGKIHISEKETIKEIVTSTEKHQPRSYYWQGINNRKITKISLSLERMCLPSTLCCGAKPQIHITSISIRCSDEGHQAEMLACDLTLPKKNWCNQEICPQDMCATSLLIDIGLT